MTLYSGPGISLFMSEPLWQMKQPRHWEGGKLCKSRRQEVAGLAREQGIRSAAHLSTTV